MPQTIKSDKQLTLQTQSSSLRQTRFLRHSRISLVRFFKRSSRIPTRTKSLKRLARLLTIKKSSTCKPFSRSKEVPLPSKRQLPVCMTEEQKHREALYLYTKVSMLYAVSREASSQVDKNSELLLHEPLFVTQGSSCLMRLPVHWTKSVRQKCRKL